MIHTVKTITAVILVMALMLALLAGCGKEQPAAQDPVTLGQEGTVPGSIPADFRLPQLNPDLPAAEEFSRWVTGVYEEWSSLIDWYQEAYALEEVHLDYRWGIYDGILSVTMVVGERTATGWPYPHSFTIDLQTGKQLTLDRFLEIKGCTREQVENYIRRVQQSDFDYELEQLGNSEALKEMQEKSVSSENLRNIRILLDASKDGEAVLLVPILYYVNTESGTLELDVPGNYYAYFFFPDFTAQLSADPAPETCGEEPEEQSPAGAISIVTGAEGTLEGENTSFRVPAMEGSGNLAGEFNQWANERFERWKQSLSWYRDAFDTDQVNLDYCAGEYDGILAVTFRVGKAHLNGGPHFSIDLSTGTQLTMERFLELRGIQWEQLEEYIRTRMQEHFSWEKEHYGAVSGLEEAQQKMISSENLRNSGVMLDASADGALVLTVPVLYGIAADTNELIMYDVPVNGLYFYEYDMAKIASKTETGSEPQISDPETEKYITPGEEGSLPGDIPATYRLPAMNESLAAAPEFRQWIGKRHEDWFTTASWIQSAQSAESIHLDYHCGIYDDLLSVTMEYALVMGGEETRGWPYSESFTVDLRTGERLTADRFITLYGGSWEQMEEFLRTQLKEHYTRMREFFAGVEGIEEMQEKELASENIRKVRVVLDASRGGQILVLIPQLFTTTVDKQLMLTEEDFYQFPVDSPDEIFG